jgi:hypothetical protein
LPDIVVGHIPYGQGNEGNSMSWPMNSWVQQWLLKFGANQEDGSQLIRLARERAIHRLCHIPAPQRELLQRRHGARGVLLVLSAYAAGGGKMKEGNAMETTR